MASDPTQIAEWRKFGALEPEPMLHEAELRNVQAQLNLETSTKDQMERENVQLRQSVHPG
eukprot:12181527-Heterocapsa_arctica.AAC.1